MSKLRDFGKIDKQYREYKDNKENIKRLYENIKQEYGRDKNLNISLERVYLINEKEKYKGLNISLLLGLLTIVYSVSMSVLINQVIKNMNIYLSIFFTFIFMFILIISIILAYRKSIINEKNERIYFDIRLAALEEIEKERKSSIDNN